MNFPYYQQVADSILGPMNIDYWKTPFLTPIAYNPRSFPLVRMPRRSEHGKERNVAVLALIGTPSEGGFCQ